MAADARAGQKPSDAVNLIREGREELENATLGASVIPNG